MKQVIVLISSILLGIFIVSCIIGDGGLLETMQELWNNEIAVRNMQVVGP